MSLETTTAWEIGAVVSAPPRSMTRERMRWYCDALETTSDEDGVFRIAEPTIHTDDEYARSQGLPGIIADGMISTNWISSLLIEAFGPSYIGGGELRTRFVRPIYEDEVITTRLEVTHIEERGADRVARLDVRCLTADGEVCTVGDAVIPLPS